MPGKWNTHKGKVQTVNEVAQDRGFVGCKWQGHNSVAANPIGTHISLLCVLDARYGATGLNVYHGRF